MNNLVTAESIPQHTMQQADEYFMREALKEAKKAYEAREVPVGAVVVSDNRIIARSHNQVEQLRDATAHAEMLALTAAFDYMGGKYLRTCTLYVTLEPCCMCSGATYWAQLGRLVFGANDPRRGYRTVGRELLHPCTEVVTAVLGKEAAQYLTSFFQSLRS
jgi:tRNA(adenine34) deaminase